MPRWTAARFPALCILAAMALGASPVAAQTVRYVDAGRGPVPVYLPSTYDDAVPMPLIVMLHGYGASGATQEAYFRFRSHAEALGFMLTTPDGTVDAGGSRFWNATDACCNFYGSSVDDSGYLRDLIDLIKIECTVDDDLVCLVGHSNGGFMSYRMACDHADTIASIASLAGATFDDPDDCVPASTVHTLQIHGTADTVVRYDGGCFGACYPGAVQTAETWAAYNGCSPAPDLSAPPLDLDRSIPGNETTVALYETACSPGGSAELWTIVGGSHVPSLSAEFAPRVIEWLLSHPRRCPADFNGDGLANTQDVIAFLNAWSIDEPAADCNRDGAIDTLDVLCFLSLWAAGC